MKKVNDFQKFWFLALVPNIACAFVFYFYKNIKVEKLLDIQFSDTVEGFFNLTEGYQNVVLTNNHLFDFFFILCYSTLFLLSVKLISLALDFRFSKKIYSLSLVPGLFDCFENTFFLGLINGCSNCFEGYFWAVRIKWTFLIVFIEIIIAILLFYVIMNVYRLICQAVRLINFRSN